MKGQLKPDAWKISSKLQKEKNQETTQKFWVEEWPCQKQVGCRHFTTTDVFSWKFSYVNFLWKKSYDIHLRETGLILLLIVLSGIHFATSGIASFLMAEQSWINIGKQVKMLPYH